MWDGEGGELLGRGSEEAGAVREPARTGLGHGLEPVMFFGKRDKMLEYLYM